VNNARYIMIGGFLGAGKSTSVGRLARRLTDEHQSVGLITNDQGSGLVDTLTLRSQGFPVEEIAGGCFCCRFNSLKAAAETLSTATRPDVFIAEPVGSCTDLVATVSYPLRRIYGSNFRIAPLSVLVDPIRTQRILGLEDGRKFSANVTYVYRKQLEEADFIVINKTDLLSDNKLQILQESLATEFPDAEILAVSARHGVGLDTWFDRLIAEEMPQNKYLELDYDTYADGEAQLGWLNCTVELSSPHEVDGNEVLENFTLRIQSLLATCGVEIAHLKMTLSPDSQACHGTAPTPLPDEIGVVNLVRLDGKPEVSHRLSEPLRNGQIIVNLRAEAAPEQLQAELRRAIEGETLRQLLRVEHLECFRPGRPEPTYRAPGRVPGSVEGLSTDG